MMKKPEQTGSILVELLVVMVIVGVVMVGMVTAFGNISRGQAKADKRLEATQYAIEGMEALYNLSRNDDPDLPAGWSRVRGLVGVGNIWIEYGNSYADLFVAHATSDPQELGSGFERYLTVTEPSVDLITVVSRVCWDDGCDTANPNVAKTVQYESKFARRP